MVRRRMILLACALAACSPTADGNDATGTPEPSAPATTAGGGVAQPATDPGDQPWSEAGLEAQPRLDAYRARIPPDLDWRPAASPWRPATPELAARLRDIPPSTLPQVMVAVQLALEPAGVLGEDVWEVTSRVLRRDDGGATGVVLRWGFQDDAVAGHDVRVRLSERDDGWIVESADERYQCRRGLSDEGLCL